VPATSIEDERNRRADRPAGKNTGGLPRIEVGLGLKGVSTEEIACAASKGRQGKPVELSSPSSADLFLREGGGNFLETWYPSVRGKLVDELGQDLSEL
jgi:hypothetical protein